MNPEEVIGEYQTLGGIAQNIKVEKGRYGCGIFPKVANANIKIVTPAKLLISTSHLVLDRSHQIRIREGSGLDKKIIEFFERYQQFLGWGKGGLTELNEYHRALTQLPKKIREYMFLLGWSSADFDKKGAIDFLSEYCISRQIKIDNDSKIMPMLDLINHSPSGRAYTIHNGVSIKGLFKGEVLARYHSRSDAFHFYKNYRIVSPSDIVLSCHTNINLPSGGMLKISRSDSVVTKDGKNFLPVIQRKGDELQFAFVQLSQKKGDVAAKQIFVNQLKKLNISESIAVRVFDGLISHNRRILTNLLNECASCNNRVAKQLESIALSQLTLMES